jgi:hypothetical protein
MRPSVRCFCVLLLHLPKLDELQVILLLMAKVTTGI